MDVKILRPGDDLSEALWIRDEVFTKEQGFSNPDLDKFDAVACHVLLCENGSPVATGRVFHEETGGPFVLGRIAVLKAWRGHSLGRLLVEELEKIAAAQGAETLELGAQVYAVPFYQKCGFCPTGKRYMDEFCEHEMMLKRL